MAVDRSSALLAAAAAVFARRGFHASTVADIARAAGVSQGLLYRYFAGKEALVVALVEQVTERLYRGVEHADTLDAALRVLFEPDDALGGSRSEGALLIEVLAEARRNPRVAEVVRAADARVAVALADRIVQAQRQGHVRPVLDAEAAADVLLALADGLALRAGLTDEPDATLDATVEDAVARLLFASGGGS